MQEGRLMVSVSLVKKSYLGLLLILFLEALFNKYIDKIKINF